MVPIGVTDGQKGEGTKGGVVAIGVRDSQPASQTDRKLRGRDGTNQIERQTGIQKGGGGVVAMTARYRQTKKQGES